MCKPLNWIENKCEIYGRTKREIEDDFEFDVPVDVVNFEQGQSVSGIKCMDCIKCIDMNEMIHLNVKVLR